jgi:hypothetical protein
MYFDRMVDRMTFAFLLRRHIKELARVEGFIKDLANNNQFWTNTPTAIVAATTMLNVCTRRN